LAIIEERLDSDDRVVGWGLVGSFGRGAADDWSDLDLLLVADDAAFNEFADPTNSLWASASLFVDARRNAPLGAMSYGTIHVHDGWPIGADWYLYPRSLASWPADCAVRKGSESDVAHIQSTFADWVASGPRQDPLAVTTAQELEARAMMLPIVAKYIADRVCTPTLRRAPRPSRSRSWRCPRSIPRPRRQATSEA
jgi:hypothetical protein